MGKWIDEGKYLGDCASVFEIYKPLDNVLLDNILSKAVALSDVTALITLMHVAARNFIGTNRELIVNLFVPAIDSLTNLNNASWAADPWFRTNLTEVFEGLDESGVDSVLANLLSLKEVNYNTEGLVATIAQRYPEKVLAFFHDRVFKEKEDDILASAFDAIPYDFNQLRKVLSSHPNLVVDTVVDWYDGDYSFFIYRGGRLIYNIYPEIPEEVGKIFMQMVRSGEKDKLSIVMAVLRNYQGNSVVNNLCKEIIKIVPQSSPHLSEVSAILESTGVLRGDFGGVDAKIRKKGEIADWLNDPDKKVKAFSKKYIDSLETGILLEKRRAEERIEMDKHQFGDDKTNDE